MVPAVKGVPPIAETPVARLEVISPCPNNEVCPTTGQEAAPIPSSPDDSDGTAFVIGVGIDCGGNVDEILCNGGTNDNNDDEEEGEDEDDDGADEDEVLEDEDEEVDDGVQNGEEICCIDPTTDDGEAGAPNDPENDAGEEVVAEIAADDTIIDPP